MGHAIVLLLAAAQTCHQRAISKVSLQDTFRSPEMISRILIIMMSMHLSAAYSISRRCFDTMREIDAFRC